MSGLKEADTKLGGNGVPTQCQLQALGHRAPASGKCRPGEGERIANCI
jgi:hypothetical protein